MQRNLHLLFVDGICTYFVDEICTCFVDGICTCFSLWSNLNDCCHWRVLLVGIKQWAKQFQNHELWWVSNSENPHKIQNYFWFVGFQNLVFSNYTNKYVKYWKEPKYENVERDFVCTVIGVWRGTKLLDNLIQRFFFVARGANASLRHDRATNILGNP